MIMIHVISMPHVSILLVAMTVNVCQVSWEMDLIVQVSLSLLQHILVYFQNKICSLYMNSYIKDIYIKS